MGKNAVKGYDKPRPKVVINGLHMGDSIVVEVDPAVVVHEEGLLAVTCIGPNKKSSVSLSMSDALQLSQAIMSAVMNKRGKRR